MNDLLVDATLTKNFAQELLERNGACPDEAAVVGDVLIWCDMCGHRSQGLYRLPFLIKRLREGGIISPCNAKFERKSSTVQMLDGKGGFGQFLAVKAVRRAVELARHEGVSVVAVRNSSHFGAAGYFANLAAEAGMVGLVTSNSFPTVAVYGGTRPVLGTNPMAIGAPRRNGRPILIDMGTSFGSRTNFLLTEELRGHADRNAAVDGANGTDGEIGKLADGTLLPLGARAFALGLMVEILSGILTGAEFSSGLRSFYRDSGEPGGNGHLFICLDIGSFMPLNTFLTRMEYLIELLTSSGDIRSKNSVRLPGEKRWRSYRESEEAGAFLIDHRTASALDSIGRDVQIEPPWNLPANTRPPRPSNSVPRQSSRN